MSALLSVGVVFAIGGLLLILGALMKAFRASFKTVGIEVVPVNPSARIILFALGIGCLVAAVSLTPGFSWPGGSHLKIKTVQPDVTLTSGQLKGELDKAIVPNTNDPVNDPKTYTKKQLGLPAGARIRGAWYAAAFNPGVAEQFERLVVVWDEETVTLHARPLPGAAAKNQLGQELQIRLYVIYEE
jgi:hypothetical protein